MQYCCSLSPLFKIKTYCKLYLLALLQTKWFYCRTMTQYVQSTFKKFLSPHICIHIYVYLCIVVYISLGVFQLKDNSPLTISWPYELYGINLVGSFCWLVASIQSMFSHILHSNWKCKMKGKGKERKV